MGTETCWIITGNVMHSLPKSCAARMREVTQQSYVTTSPAEHLAGWHTTSEDSTVYSAAAVYRQYHINMRLSTGTRCQGGQALKHGRNYVLPRGI